MRRCEAQNDGRGSSFVVPPVTGDSTRHFFSEDDATTTQGEIFLRCKWNAGKNVGSFNRSRVKPRLIRPAVDSSVARGVYRTRRSRVIVPVESKDHGEGIGGGPSLQRVATEREREKRGINKNCKLLWTPPRGLLGWWLHGFWSWSESRWIPVSRVSSRDAEDAGSRHSGCRFVERE